jgi:hypothetical protein
MNNRWQRSSTVDSHIFPNDAMLFWRIAGEVSQPEVSMVSCADRRFTPNVAAMLDHTTHPPSDPWTNFCD